MFHTLLLLAKDVPLKPKSFFQTRKYNPCSVLNSLTSCCAGVAFLYNDYLLAVLNICAVYHWTNATEEGLFGLPLKAMFTRKRNTKRNQSHTRMHFVTHMLHALTFVTGTNCCRDLTCSNLTEAWSQETLDSICGCIFSKISHHFLPSWCQGFIENLFASQRLKHLYNCCNRNDTHLSDSTHISTVQLHSSSLIYPVYIASSSTQYQLVPMTTFFVRSVVKVVKAQRETALSCSSG